MSPRKRRFYVAPGKIGDWCGDTAGVGTAKDRNKGIAQGIKTPRTTPSSAAVLS
ncbi:MAG: hypothetical protein H6662_02800 [Ardenticatenaceae bacterium]|nr:hypothetical protein [Ardenticatenaceae bacterium]